MSCPQILEKLDRYLDGELPAGDASAVSRHLETCHECAAVRTNRTALRERMRRLARDADVPANMHTRADARIDSETAPAYHRRGFLAAAAAVVLSFGAYLSWRSTHRTDAELEKDYIASVVSDIPPVLSIGLRQHIHCAVFRHYPNPAPDIDELTRTADAQCAALIPVMRQHVPRGFQVVMAHRCEYEGRQYTHVIARHGVSLISLLVTRPRQGEGFKGTSMDSAGGDRGFSVAGFETSGYLVYVVSDLNQLPNYSTLDAMAPALRTALT